MQKFFRILNGGASTIEYLHPNIENKKYMDNKKDVYGLIIRSDKVFWYTFYD